jgi:hypothetical protein
MSVPLTPSADKNCITARWACLEESMARSLTVISLLFQSTTHCRSRVYTKFLLTYTPISRRNRKVPPLGIMALQPQSHFHLGTPYNLLRSCTFISFLYETHWCNILQSVGQVLSYHWSNWGIGRLRIQIQLWCNKLDIRRNRKILTVKLQRY